MWLDPTEAEREDMEQRHTSEKKRRHVPRRTPFKRTFRVRGAPGPVYLPPLPARTLEDMTEEEILALEREYGCKVHRPEKSLDGSGEEA